MNRQQRLKRKFMYLQNLYEITFEGLSQELLDECQVDINFELKDNVDCLIKIDQDINQLKKRVKYVYNTDKELLDESRDLFHRLSLVHKALYETMRTEFGICDCWENEKGRLEYVKC